MPTAVTTGLVLIAVFIGAVMWRPAAVMLIVIAVLGIFHLVQTPEILWALNPWYAVQFFMTDKLLAWDKFQEKVLPRVPMRRWGRPEDFGAIAVYLLISVIGYRMTTTAEFFLLAVLVGMALDNAEPPRMWTSLMNSISLSQLVDSVDTPTEF